MVGLSFIIIVYLYKQFTINMKTIMLFNEDLTNKQLLIIES